MALIKYRSDKALSPVDYLQDEFNRLLNNPWGTFLAERSDILAPALDVWEDKDNVYVETDLPGFNQKDIKLNFKDDTLSISAQKEENQEEKKKGYYRCERFQGSFYRAAALPSHVDSAKIAAKYQDGVLKVTLPKKEEAKEKEIQIEVK